MLNGRHLPNLVIAGAMRCGTTSLYRHLDSHPEVFMAKPKELHFFDRHYDRGLEWYVARFAEARDERVRGEATPMYLYDAAAVRRMARTLPDARVIVLLRNPVDRAYSHYWHNRARGREKRSFVEALAEESEPSGGSRRAHFAYRGRSRYVEQLERLFRHFPRGNVYVGFCEELKDSPAVIYRQICRFLGVDDSFVPSNLGRPFNEYVGFRLLALRYLTRKLRAGKLGPIRFSGRILGKLNTARSNSYPPMGEGVREDLADDFREDCEVLAQLLGRTLPFDL